MATMNISLPDLLKTWVEERSDNAEFSNSSDYVRHLIRSDQQRRAAAAELQAAIDEGVNSGPAQAFDMDDLKAQMRAKHVG